MVLGCVGATLRGLLGEHRPLVGAAGWLRRKCGQTRTCSVREGERNPAHSLERRLWNCLEQGLALCTGTLPLLLTLTPLDLTHR